MLNFVAVISEGSMADLNAIVNVMLGRNVN